MTKIVKPKQDSADNTSVSVQPLKSTHNKCPRCQKWTPSENYDFLCNRCVRVILSDYKDHSSVPFILKNIQERGLSPEDNPTILHKE